MKTAASSLQYRPGRFTLNYSPNFVSLIIGTEGLTAAFVLPATAQAAYTAPYVPPGCSLVVVPNTSFPYPYRINASSTTTGWYVYCGIEQTKFRERAGQQLITLPTTPQIRKMFEDANYGFYIFTNSAQAQSLMGTSFITAAAGPNVRGYHQGDIIAGSNVQTPYIAMFEQVKQANGSYLSYPNQGDPNFNLIYDFDSTIRHETGHAIDSLSGSTTNGSESTQFQSFISGDRTWFNSINGCKNNGWESSLWGAAKTTICLNGQKRVGPPNYYSTKSNLQIVREFDSSEPWQRYFRDSPTINEKREVYAELMQIARINNTNGPGYVAFDAWIKYIYYCGNKFTSYRYSNWALLTSCTRPALTP